MEPIKLTKEQSEAVAHEIRAFFRDPDVREQFALEIRKAVDATRPPQLDGATVARVVNGSPR